MSSSIVSILGTAFLCWVAVTVPAGPDHEQLEPSSRKQEDAWGLNVPQCPDYGGQRTQHYILYTWFLPQPVSFKLFSHLRVF